MSSMTDITIHNIKDERAGLNLEQQYLLEALRVGLTEAMNGQSRPADRAYFDGLRKRAKAKAGSNRVLA